MNKLKVIAAATAFLATMGCGAKQSNSTVTITSFSQPASSLQEFDSRLSQFKQDLKLPGMAVVISRDQQIVWSKGYGFADLENNIPASPTTSYHLASLTKTFASTVVLQLVEQGKVSLDDPVSMYGINLASPGLIRVRHLMTHTSEGVPGAEFHYNGNRYGFLDQVIQVSAGKSFAELLVPTILAPLSLKQTAPNVDDPAFNLSGFDKASFTKNLAKPYVLSSANTLVPSQYPSSFNTAAGLISSANDVAQYSMAIDRNLFLKETTKNLAFTQATTNSGQPIPYGLGWFVQNISGTKVVWHYGLWTCNSSLIIKIPDRRLTLVVLTNSDNLSNPFDLGAGDIMVSPVAREFINAFVVGNVQLP